MSSSLVVPEVEATGSPPLSLPKVSLKSLQVDLLAREDEREVLDFLSSRPIHTIYMVGLIRDNGLVSPLNRGVFCAYRNQEGELEGVALLGQKTVIEAQSQSALEAFAQIALAIPYPHLIRGEEEQVERLQVYLSGKGRVPHRVFHELLLEQRACVEKVERIRGLHPAELADSDQVIAINTMMAFEETGINPLERDPQGFRQRVTRRIRQGRVWVLVDKGRIVFKADVISETPQVIFIEGVHVDREHRGRGNGFRCLTQLGRQLLARTSSVCLVVNQENKKAQALYHKAGYRLDSNYVTAFFK
jgi:ribosomal protein S18 acetylase RimI-like enzyme